VTNVSLHRPKVGCLFLRTSAPEISGPPPLIHNFEAGSAEAGISIAVIRELEQQLGPCQARMQNLILPILFINLIRLLI